MVVTVSSSLFVIEMARAPSRGTITPARNTPKYEIRMASEQQPKSPTKICTDPHNIREKRTRPKYDQGNNHEEYRGTVLQTSR
jgi:hypothetical protein